MAHEDIRDWKAQMTDRDTTVSPDLREPPNGGEGEVADSGSPGTDPLSTLRMSDNWSLPLASVTGTHAIVGIRGGGKTSTAVVLVEELIRNGQRAIVIDPTGVWWGLTRQSDGTPSRLPVVVLGGLKGGLPLHLEDAAADARYVDGLRGTTVVVDVSQLRIQTIKSYVGAFLEELFYSHDREPIHIVLDEADLFAPQKATRSDQAVLGPVEDIWRRGRTRGFGGTLIGHRPAEISKDVLSQTSTLIAMRLTLDQDRSAIAGWTSHDPDPDRRTRLLDELPTLAPGTALVSDPIRQYLANVTIRPRTTLDSSPTPTPTSPAASPAGGGPSAPLGPDRIVRTPEITVPTAPSSGAARRILAILATAPARGLHRDTVAAELGFTPTGGTMAAYLRQVGGRVEVDGDVVRLRAGV